MNILTGVPYLDEQQLKGFDSYKYSCRDTSPYSVYVVNPCWNKMVELVPRWVAPNLMTMVGFLLILSTYILLGWYDYDFKNTGHIPAWVWVYSAIAHFTGYNLDGMDGKQARRTKTSTPLGELFDHGLDSIVAFTLPIATASGLGLIGGVGLTEEIVFFTVLLGLLGFYVSHWEKYNTGILFLPWIFDFVHQFTSFAYLLTGIYGVSIWPDLERGFNISLIAVYCAGMAGGTGISILVSLWNVTVSYTNREHKREGLIDSISPFFTFSFLITGFIIWSQVSPNGLLKLELRCLCAAMGIAFSNITCNLIISQMAGVRFRVYNSLVLLAYVSLTASFFLPQLEIAILYTYLIVAVISHIHFGYSVVNQLCTHFQIECFRIPFEPNKNS